MLVGEKENLALLYKKYAIAEFFIFQHATDDLNEKKRMKMIQLCWGGQAKIWIDVAW